MIGFSRDGKHVVAVLEQAEAQVMGLVVAQVAGLVELHRQECGADDFPAGAFGVPGPRAEALLDDLEDDLDDDLDDLDLEDDEDDEDDLEADSVFDFGFAAPGDGELADDPVLARLFPDGYKDDPEAAAELRGLIQADLHAQKLENATTMLATLPMTGGEVRLDGDEAESWLMALNDARLALGTRLEMTEETDLLDELSEAASADPSGARVLALSVYHLLGLAQETLVEALTD